MTRRWYISPLVLILLVSLWLPLGTAEACVGRKLVLGALQDDRQGIVSRILSILIHERTGTTVEVEFFPTEEKIMERVRKGKVDLYVGYVGTALEGLQRDWDSLPPEESYRLAKRLYEEELNLIWLKPMGFSGKDGAGRGLGWAAVVVRKDALKKFPALPRLLEKIGTRVIMEDALLDGLVLRGQAVKPAKVAREFLKEKKLI